MPDIAVEEARGRDTAVLRRSCRGPTRARFDHAMRTNQIRRVEVVVADAGSVEYAAFAPIAFALVDVDLYQPVRAVLEKLISHVIDGGVIVADDCEAGVFEGAHEAYRDFCVAHNIAQRVEHGKLGVIRV